MKTAAAFCLPAILFGLFHLVPLGVFAQLAAKADKPNIVIFFIDDMGFADPSCFGNPHVKTPHIDKMAAEGIKLENFYVNSPICSASRTALTTGQYQGRWGIHSYLASRAANESRGMRHFLDPESPTTAKALKAAGYATAHFGKWHMGGGRDIDEAPRPQAYGMDESLVCFEGMGDKLMFNEKRYKSGTFEDIYGEYQQTVVPKHKLTEIYADRSIDFIKRQHQAGRPFYLRLFPNDVHDAHVPVPGTDEKWKGTTDNHYEQKFFAVLEEMDRQLGRVIDAVDELGLGENTLILFTSDNGPTDWPKYYGQGFDPPGFTGPFFGRKWSLFEGGIRMPFIARWKGTIPAGVVDKESVVAAIDLAPTLRRFAGAAAHPAPDGVDRGDVLTGKPSARSTPVFWQYGAPHAKLMPGKRAFRSPSFAMRDGDWKFLANPDGSSAHLFNLRTDPGEQDNLFEAESERAAAMWAHVQKWAAEIGYKGVGGEGVTLSKPVPLPKVEDILWKFGTGELTLKGHELVTQNNTWFLNGKGSHLALPRAKAPDVKKSGLRILATVDLKPAETDGVIFAHGGNRTGYALYLDDRRPVFVVTQDYERSVVTGPDPLVSGERSRVEAKLDKNGTMTLRLNGTEIATGKSKLLSATPGDSIEIGSDLVQPVGDYKVPNAFGGIIYHLRLDVQK